MIVELIPVNVAVPPEEIQGRIQSGWRIFGQALVAHGGGVITPDNPTGAQAVPVTIWVLPEPMVPISELFHALFTASEVFKESPTSQVAIGHVSTLLTGKTVTELRQSMEEAQGAADQSPDAPRGVVLSGNGSEPGGPEGAPGDGEVG